MITDVIEFELFKNTLHSIADEMGLTLLRTSYSGVLRGNMDFAPAILDASGRLVAQGIGPPGHLGSMPTALACLMAGLEDEVAPGDVYILNDPYQGGSHLPDVFVFKPIHFEGRLLAFAAAVSHHTDIGGRVPGSNAADSTEIFQEGLRIPPLKLYDRGKRNETLFALIERNVRVPPKFFGDLRAQLAACHTCEQAMLEIARRHGHEWVERHMSELIDYAELLTRAAIRELPDGTYNFVDHLDDDGIDLGTPVRLEVTITKANDGIVVDWTGTSPQVKGAINSPYSFTLSSSYCAIQCVLPADIPQNEGVFRAINVVAPEGTVANPVPPASCAARALTGFRMGDCMFGALAKMLPDRIFACSDGGNTGVTIAGYDPERKPFIYVDFICGAWGGRPYADGVDGISSIYANLGSHSIEVAEAEQPIQFLRYEFIQDAMGPGKFRGGAPFRRDYKFLGEEGILQVRSDRRHFLPYGLYGGGPGRPSMNYLNPDGENRVLPAKVTMGIRRGDTLRHELAGAGGWGDPLERDPERVLRDVRNAFVSRDSAHNDYGVVLLGNPLRIDHEATSARRDRLRAIRNWDTVPEIAWKRSVANA